MGEVKLLGRFFFKKPTMKRIVFILLLIFCGAHAQELSESDLLNYINYNSAYYGSSALTQIGTGNSADIQGDTYNVTQVGNNQQFYYTETSLVPSNLNLNIEGNNNYVEVYGNNSILDRMQIEIKGDNRNVIIRNYP